jgi:galacturonokinase
MRRYRLARGLVGVTTGKLNGGGVSSSAAVGVAFLLAFEDVNGLHVNEAENIELDQAIENLYLGLRIGILDPAAILLSERGRLTLIDCAKAQHELITPSPALARFRILLAFSGVRRTLMGTNYNRRVEECTSAALTLLDAAGRPNDHPVLGNLTAHEFALHHHRLKDSPARRAAHYFSEVERVRGGVDAWKRGDLWEFGRLMSASGESSIVNYECGSPPLIDLYRILLESDGVFGARFSGAGFGGCCVALVDPNAAPVTAARVVAEYRSRYPELAGDASVVLCDSDDGARILLG